MKSVKGLKLPIPTHTLGVLNRAAELIVRLPKAKALELMKKSTLAELDVITVSPTCHCEYVYLHDLTRPHDLSQFTPSEIDKLAVSVEERGGLDAHQASKADGRTPAHNVRYYRVWREENLKLMFEGLPKGSSSRGPAAIAGPSMPSPTRGSTLEEDQIYNSAVDKGTKLVCDACATRTSKRWWKIPRTVGSGVWCEADGQTYLKYGWVPRQESARIATVGDKREATPLSGANPAKRPKVSPIELELGADDKADVFLSHQTASAAATAAANAANAAAGGPHALRATPCACCNHAQPADTMLKCSLCTISVHTGSSTCSRPTACHPVYSGDPDMASSSCRLCGYPARVSVQSLRLRSVRERRVVGEPNRSSARDHHFARETPPRLG